MQTVEKQVVLEENWQVLSQLFFHRSHSAWKTLSHRGCWPGSTSLGVSHSPHRLYYGY